MLEKISTISLFSGCGGLDFGFLQEGYNIIWANDNMKDACNSYRINIGTHIACKDITEIDPSEIPVADVIIGGPPCQGFSGIGKQDPRDKRSLLIWNYLNIIKKIRPKIFLFENVTGFKSARNTDGSKVIDTLTESFKAIGYSINLYTLNAADYGVPQKRRRVFIIGNRLGIDISPPPQTHSNLNDRFNKWISTYEALSDLDTPTQTGIVEYTKSPDCDFQLKMRKNSTTSTDLHIIPYASKKDNEIIMSIKPGGNYLDVPDHIATKRILYFKKTGGRTTTYGRLDPKRPSYTLNTYFDRPNIGCNIHYKENRMLTIREGMRLQSFPDNFKIVSSNRRNYYVQVGNAVPPLLGLAWAKHIKKIINSNKIHLSVNANTNR